MKGETRAVYSVSELLGSARSILESSFLSIYVEGEICEFNLAPSGHMYLKLKDEKGSLPCAFFKGSNQSLTFKPELGMKVIAGGTLTLYERDGKFQLNIRSMEPKGLGALQLAFEQLKKKLLLEGLFEQDRKKPVPAYPRRIALITSPSGAAIRDFMKILETRVGIEEVELFPVTVQGNEAPLEITTAIEKVSSMNRHDLLVVTRGGGSLEDLAAFNDENVVRALANCSIPTISAIGHEVDFTLCDFVSDRREPTPTAAAAHLAPGKDEVADRLSHIYHRLQEAMVNHVDDRKRDIRELANTLKERRPDLLLDQARQDLDYRTESLRAALMAGLKDSRANMSRLTDMVKRSTPIQRVKYSIERVKGLEAQLQAYHPHGPLKRGYAIVIQKKTGAILRSSKSVKAGERLLIQLEKGNLESEVLPSGPEEGQRTLF